MKTRSEISCGSEHLKKAVRTPKDFQIFLHARHRETNTKLGLCSSNGINETVSRAEACVANETILTLKSICANFHL